MHFLASRDESFHNKVSLVASQQALMTYSEQLYRFQPPRPHLYMFAGSASDSRFAHSIFVPKGGSNFFFWGVGGELLDTLNIE